MTHTNTHPVKLGVGVSLPHPLVLVDLLHGQTPAGLQHQHVSDKVLTVWHTHNTCTHVGDLSATIFQFNILF